MTESFRVHDPDSVKFTLQATLTLGEWRKIRSRLLEVSPAYNWPVPALLTPIENMIKQAEKSFFPSE